MYRRGSPVYRAERIEAPLLILHGRKDKRVVPLWTERMVEALEIEGKHHEVHWYDEEGHGWERRENRRDAFQRLGRTSSESTSSRTVPARQQRNGRPRRTAVQSLLAGGPRPTDFGVTSALPGGDDPGELASADRHDDAEDLPIAAWASCDGPL